MYLDLVSVPPPPTFSFILLFLYFLHFSSFLYYFMESLRNKDGVREIKFKIEDAEDEMKRKLKNSSS